MKSQGIFNFLLSGNPAVLHLHLGVLFPYCFCFQICTYIFTTQLPNLNFSLCCSTQQLYFHIYLFCSHNWTSIVGNTTFVPTPIRVLFCVFFHTYTSPLLPLCPQPHRACARSSLLLCFSIYTFIFTKSAPSLPFVLYLHLQIHVSLFPHRHLYFHPYVTGLVNGFNLYSCYENLFKEVVLQAC